MVKVNDTSNSNKVVKNYYYAPMSINDDIIIDQTGQGMYGNNGLVMAQLRQALSLNITTFNRRLEKDNRLKLMCFNQFKKLHYNEPTKNGGNTFDSVVAHFNDVNIIRSEETNDIVGYCFDYNGCIIKVFFSGRIEKYSGHKKIVSGLKNKVYSNTDMGWIRLNLGNQSFKVERLIGVLGCVYTNIMPETFKGLCVNVMDCSGNLETCKKLKIVPDFRPCNLEWALLTDNLVHGKIAHAIYKMTGHIYRFSAYDKNLIQKVNLKKIEKVKKYCNEKLLKIR